MNTTKPIQDKVQKKNKNSSLSAIDKTHGDGIENKNITSKPKLKAKKTVAAKNDSLNIHKNEFTLTPLKPIKVHKRKIKKDEKLAVILEKNEIQPSAKKRIKVIKSSTDNVEFDESFAKFAEKYSILRDNELIKRFQSVSMTNNQKGRIRQILREVLKGTPPTALPDVIHDKITSIVKVTPVLTDIDLRRLRVLYNMFKTALSAQNVNTKPKQNNLEIGGIGLKPNKESILKKNDNKLINGGTSTKEPAKMEVKKKGPKRYVVFVGNLPPDVNKETISAHFSDLKNKIRDVRIPPRKEGAKSAIAYVELFNEIAYEMALSKHHSMLCNKRINVSYTTQVGSKLSKADAKKTSAKLQALRVSGQLCGSVSLNRKRSQRRAKQRQAIKLAEAKST